MIHIEDDVVFDELLTHIGDQRVRARLIDKPFDLGIMTDKRPSQILKLVQEKADILEEIGMSGRIWHDDALRSELRLAGENLLISICRPR